MCAAILFAEGLPYVGIGVIPAATTQAFLSAFFWKGKYTMTLINAHRVAFCVGAALDVLIPTALIFQLRGARSVFPSTQK